MFSSTKFDYWIRDRRLTGIPGVAAVTAGPGLTNSITAVKNAQKFIEVLGF